MCVLNYWIISLYVFFYITTGHIKFLQLLFSNILWRNPYFCSSLAFFLASGVFWPFFVCDVPFFVAYGVFDTPYFKGRKFRGQKLSRISRILALFAKVFAFGQGNWWKSRKFFSRNSPQNLDSRKFFSRNSTQIWST